MHGFGFNMRKLITLFDTTLCSFLRLLKSHNQPLELRAVVYNVEIVDDVIEGR